MTLRELIKEMNETLELDPPIPTKDTKAATKEIKDWMKDLTDEDIDLLSPEAKATLKKKKLLPEPAPEKKPAEKAAKKTTAKKAAAKKEGKRESNEELAKRLVDEGKKIGDLKKALRKRYEDAGKEVDDEWIEKRAKIYWNIGQKA